MPDLLLGNKATVVGWMNIARLWCSVCRRATIHEDGRCTACGSRGDEFSEGKS